MLRYLEISCVIINLVPFNYENRVIILITKQKRAVANFGHLWSFIDNRDLTLSQILIQRYCYSLPKSYTLTVDKYDGKTWVSSIILVDKLTIVHNGDFAGI